MKNRNQRGWRARIACLVTAPLIASSLLAQSPIGSAFLVNPESVGSQDQPDLQFADDGDLWFVWVDSIGAPAPFGRLMARSVSPQGEIGPALVLVDTSDDPLTPALDPLVIPVQGGGFRLVYTRFSADGFAGVYSETYNSSGEVVGARTTLTPPPPLSARILAASSLPQGGFALTTLGFPCVTCPTSPPGSIFARIIAPDGFPVSRYFRVPRKSEIVVPGTRGLAVDGQGNAIVVWGGVDDLESRDSSDVRGRRFSSLGKPLGPELFVNTTTRRSQSEPSVAADESGDFVVVWQTRFPGGLLRSIFGQRFSKTGKKIGQEFRVNEDRIEKDFSPTVAMDRSGNFVVAWQSFSPARPDCVQVRARLYRRDGKPAGPEFPVAPGDAACGEAPKVAFGPNGIFAIVWQVELGFSPETGTDFDVYAARFSVPPSFLNP